MRRGKVLRWFLKLLILLMFVAIPIPALTQDSDPAPAALGNQTLKAGELDALVAPVALYPDTLLAVLLMASTYPLEVVLGTPPCASTPMRLRCSWGRLQCGWSAQ